MKYKVWINTFDHWEGLGINLVIEIASFTTLSEQGFELIFRILWEW